MALYHPPYRLLARYRLPGFALCVFTTAWTGCNREPGAPAQQTRDGRLSPLLRNLGSLHAPVTTSSAEAQKYFDQGLTLVYGFNHAEAVRSFREAARLDPNCAMAYWGQALALAPNINDPAIGPDREQQGFEAISTARQRMGPASDREKALIEALAARFAASAPRDREALNRSYATAMTVVYARFPGDPDTASLYADAVMNSMPWNYWSQDGKPRAGIPEARAALEKAIETFPEHAGARHLYIHLMEASDEVDLATPSADRLGSLVPGAGHLVHMPSHIFIRVGRYSDAAAANRKAAAADEDYIAQCRAQGIYRAAYYPHNVHFLNAALLMQGRANEALAAARKVASQHDHQTMNMPGFGFAHLLKTIPVLTMVRFGQWDGILREPEPPSDQVFGRAMYHFARGFAFAAAKKRSNVEQELDQLKKLAAEPSLAELKIFDVNSLASLAPISVAMLEGELAGVAGRGEQAAAAFRRAAELEDKLLYSEPPDWMLSPRQYLGQALLDTGRYADAERAYRQDLKRHRDNGWSLFGLEQSLRRRGKQQEARTVQERFAKSWAEADVVLTGSRF